MFEPGSFKWVCSGYLSHKSWLDQEITWKDCQRFFRPQISIPAFALLVGSFAIGPTLKAVYVDYKEAERLRVVEEERKLVEKQRESAEALAQSEELKNRFASIESRAREIMGENSIGVSEVARHLKVQFSERYLQALSKIPYSEELLSELKNTHLLIPMVPLSILEIRERVPDIFYDQSWYNDQPFARDETCRLGWILMRIDAVPNSTSKTYTEQCALLGSDEEAPPACEAVYVSAIRKTARNHQPFSDVWARTSSLSSGGSRVFVCFYDGRLYIYLWGDDSSGYIGLASSRKFQK